MGLASAGWDQGEVGPQRRIQPGGDRTESAVEESVGGTEQELGERVPIVTARGSVPMQPCLFRTRRPAELTAGVADGRVSLDALERPLEALGRGGIARGEDATGSERALQMGGEQREPEPVVLIEVRAAAMAVEAEHQLPSDGAGQSTDRGVHEVVLAEGFIEWGPQCVGFGSDIEVLEFGTEIEAQSMADADTDFNMSTFECGEQVGEQWTVCAATPVDMSAGELLTVVLDLEAPVPFDSADAHYVYAAVFDSDGDAANDFVPEAAFPRDFFRGTDRWYELIWDTSAWTVRVTQLDSAGTRTEVPSSVRAVVEGQRIQFFIDRAELPAAIPGYRVSAFRHDGAFTVETSGGDVSMGTPTLPLLPAGCGFLGAECRDDGLDRGRNGALASCGDRHSCSLVIQPGSFRGACTPSDVPRCGMGSGSCDGDLTCASPADRTGWCLTEEQLACLCSTPSGRVVVPACDS